MSAMKEILAEAQRCIIICNACRYWEGFCAVFPAMELRRVFTDPELKYFANLCHNCRGCYYACQYAPPHEFDLNFPEVMCQLRTETYKEFAWPGCLAKFFNSNGLSVFVAALVGVLLFVFGGIWANGVDAFFKPITGDGSFYKVVPYGFMFVVFTLTFLFGIFALVKGVLNMWKITESPAGGLRNPLDVFQALKDVFTMRYLDGNGDGCNYPNDEFSFIRRKYHHFTFYGFLACLVATGIAFVADDFLGIHAPYGFFSLPVLFGFFGGLSLCYGTAGLTYLKVVMDRRPYDEASVGMDMSFTMLLFLISLSGLLLFLFRSTSMMGLLLCVHLGLVFGLFITLPAGKFVHVAYRYTALVRNAREQREANT